MRCKDNCPQKIAPKKKGDWVHDHKRFHLHRRAGVHCRTAGVAATLHEVEILRLCTTYRSAVPHYHDSLHAGCMGHGGHQACLLRAEKQPAVCNDLPDAAALRHPQDHQAGSQDAGRLLCRFRLHLVGLHCHLRHHEGALGAKHGRHWALCAAAGWAAPAT